MALELTKKAGPLPVWGWAVVVAVGGYVLYKRILHGGGGSAATTNATSPGQVGTDGTGIGTGGFVPIYLNPATDNSGATDSGGTPAATGGLDCEHMSATEFVKHPECMALWASHVGHLGDPIAAIDQGVFHIPGQPGLVSVNGVVMYNPADPQGVSAMAAATQQVQAALAALPLVRASVVDPSNRTPGAVVPAVGVPGQFPAGSNASTAPGSAGAYGIAAQQQAAAGNQPNTMQHFMSVLSGRG